jgi:uncharacterized protein YceK
MGMRLLLILALTTLITGCSTVLYPLDKSDIIEIKAGEVVSGVTVSKHGYYLADEWLEKVAKARVAK